MGLLTLFKSDALFSKAASMYLPAACLALGFLHQVATANTIKTAQISTGKLTNQLDRVISIRRFHGGDTIALQVIIPGRKGHSADTATVHCDINKLFNQKRYSMSVIRSNLLGGEREMLVNISMHGKEFGSKNTEPLDLGYLDKGNQEVVSYFFRQKSRRPKDNYCRLYTCEITYVPARLTVVTRVSQVAILSIDGSKC
ncbi:hypothetical protein PoB_004361500 [Plakobranchus ocellatus]|uniref:Uncharacterized protein n=1 Tax=Plakobranchus ocellatus TaxID=259542 RepID=A0AAV4B951_9GAST|nr:hypothetical protein PoB_004361500 [Plakobranchus ocellatus]